MGEPVVYAALRDRRGEPFVIRQAWETDARAVLAHKDQVFRETDLLLQSIDDLDRDVQREGMLLRQFRTSYNSVFLLAEKEGRVVGTLSIFGGLFKRNRHVGQLGMGVLRDHWGVGIGSALIDQALEWAASNRYLRKVTLQVYHTNERAIRLYLNKGFVEEGVLVDEVVLDDGSYVDLLAMRRFV